ncbi:hypothetical protein OF83DRAFT_1185218 [Amylostereum chailletii]|nr:hypothetical protein OF83DRAFT_1185218 [Amylostereum chailletii]
MAEAAKQIAWYRNLYQEIGYPSQVPFTLYGDNRGALISAQNPVTGKSLKHICCLPYSVGTRTRAHRCNSERLRREGKGERRRRDIGDRREPKRAVTVPR